MTRRQKDAGSNTRQPAAPAGGRVVPSADFWDGIAPESMASAIMAIALSSETPDNRAQLRILLQNSACLPDFAGPTGKTPLMAAAARGNAGALEILASHPLVALDRQDKMGWTALHYAAAAGNDNCVRILLSHRATHSLSAKDGRTPVEVAENTAVEDAFWENRDFARHMKVHAPDHPKFQPPPEPMAAETPALAAPLPAPAAPPEADPLKDAFFRAVTSVGLEWKLNPGVNVRTALIEKMIAMNGAEFAQSYKTIKSTGAAFDWPRVFIKAAGAGNTAVLRALQDDIFFDQRTINQALSAAVAAGDLRDVAHHLALWGAEPDAHYELGGQLAGSSIIDVAFANKRTGIFEELVTWRGDMISKSHAGAFRLLAQPKTSRAGMLPAIDVLEKRLEFKKMRGSKLKNAFNAAVDTGQISGTMAGYAEARRDRFLRGSIEVSKETGGGAIAVALRHEKYEFARLLIAEGFSLSDAHLHLRADLRLNGTAKAKQFADEHLSGKMNVISVPDVGRKRRSEIHILTYGGYRGHYGIF